MPRYQSSGPSLAEAVALAGPLPAACAHPLNGHPAWAFNADGPVESQIAAAGRAAFVGSNGGQVYALTR